MSVVDYNRTPPVRTPDPLHSSRRRALERLGSLRAMGLGAIGDIGSVSFGTVSTLTWATASDWDSAQSEAGVVHEPAQTGYDVPGDAAVTLGYPTFDRGGTSLVAYYPGNESSGSTLNDAVGSQDMSANGPTVASNTGPFGRNAWNYDGTDDRHTVTGEIVDASSAWTITGWVRIPDDGSREAIWNFDSANGGEWLSLGTQEPGPGVFDWKVFSNGRTPGSSSVSDSFPGPYHYAVTYDGSGGLEIFRDGSSLYTDSISGTSFLDSINDTWIGGSDDPGEYLSNWAAETRWYSRVLSASEISDLHAAGTGGNLFTATKSFSFSVQPDLQNLDYDLNGETVTLDVYGSPGTGSEEIVSQTLDGSTAYALTWSSGHTDFAVDIKISTSSVAATPPVVRKVELTS